RRRASLRTAPAWKGGVARRSGLSGWGRSASGCARQVTTCSVLHGNVWPMWNTVQFGLLIALVGLLVIAAVGDVRRYLIPNRLCAVVAALALPYWIAACMGTGAPLLPA